MLIQFVRIIEFMLAPMAIDRRADVEFSDVVLDVGDCAEPASFSVVSTEKMLERVSFLKWTSEEPPTRLDTLALCVSRHFGPVTLIVVVVLALTLSKSASFLGCGP